MDSLSDEAVNQEVVPVPMNPRLLRQRILYKELLPKLIKGSSLEFDFHHGATLRVTDQTSDALLAKVCLGYLPMLNNAICFKQIFIMTITDLRSRN